MAYRTVMLASGDTVRISESVLRGMGPEGPKGPAGPPGVATTIRGNVPNAGSLPPTGRQGDAYIADDTGHLWVWDTLSTPPQWVDVGRIVGPSGVTSIGACRTRSDTKTLAVNALYAVEYTATPWNDPDPLESGNVDPTAGAVLDEDLSTPTETVVWSAEKVYYLVTTRFTVASDVEEPTITMAWRNASNSTNSAIEMVRTFEWEISAGAEGDVITSHTCVLATSNADKWQFTLKSDSIIAISGVETIWTRVGGGSGPMGPIGPPPELVVGTVTPLVYGQPPVYTLTETSPGVYRVDVGVVAGPQGLAGSGYDTFDAIAAGGNSETDTGTPPEYWTDQNIPIPEGLSKPSVPWYFKTLAQFLYRRIVSRLTTAQITSRGVPEAGEVIFDTTTNQFKGATPVAGTNTFFLLTLSEYGQSSSVYHGAATTRPNGTIYFKYET